MRPWRHQSGGVRDGQLEWAAAQLAAAPAGALRVVAHAPPADGAPWRTRKRPVARRDHVLGALVDAGAELSSRATPTRARSPSGTSSRPGRSSRGAVVATAPGLGQPRPHRRGEARGLLVYEAGERELHVHTYIWRDGDWGLTATRRYPRGTDALADG